MNNPKYLTIDDYSRDLLKDSKVNVHDLYDDDYDVALSINIVNVRRTAGFTQKDLAAALETQQPNIARFESGSSLPSHLMIKKIARILGARPIAPGFEKVQESKRIIPFSFQEESGFREAITNTESRQTLNTNLICAIKT